MMGQLRLFFFAAVIMVTGPKTAFSQPEFIAEIPTGSTEFTTIGDLTYFTTGDALWRTDGTPEGTFELRNIRAGSFREFNGKLIFQYAPTATSAELWRSDGTIEGTLRLLVAEEVSYMEEAGGYLYFAASQPASGRELYRTDGTPGGTALVQDINPGAADGIAERSIYRPSLSRPYMRNIYPSAGVGDQLFFAADNGTLGLELWKTDGSSAGTVMVKDINAGAGDGFKPCLPGSFQDQFYFTGYTVANGWEPWASDGTNDGTHMLTEIIPGPEYSLGLQFKVELNGWLYFSVDKSDEFSTQFELWKTDGTAANTVELKDLCSDCVFDSPLLAYDNKLFFFLYVEYGTETLWETDGTPAGTRVRYSDFLDGTIPFFAIANDQVFFSTTGQGYNLDIYALDPNAGDPRIVWTFKSGYVGYGRPFDIVAVDDLVFFADHDGPVVSPGTPVNPEDAYQLFQTDGESVQSVRDLHGISLDGTFDISNYNGRVLFTRVEDFSNPKELWIYDPNSQPTISGTFTLVDADSDEDIRVLHDGDVLSKSDAEQFSIRFDPAEPAGSVMFAVNGSNVRIENEAPYALQGDINGDYTPWNKPPGAYTLTATPYSEPRAGGTAGTSLTIGFTIEPPPSECSASGTILREYWGGVQGDHVSDIPLDREPTSMNQLTIFEGPENIGRDYGTRIRGYIFPPSSGDYRFYIASNDHSELWLSSDDAPANKTRIAYVFGATNPRQWNKFASQASGAIHLEAGKRYYVEALHKQGIGTDHIAVGWQLPDGTQERPIPGSRLSPFQIENLMLASHEPEDFFDQITVYPNPATSGDAQLSVSGYDGIERSIDTDIEIINLTGDVIYSERITCGGDCRSYMMNINKQLVPGVYVVNMKSGGKKVSKRLLVR